MPELPEVETVCRGLVGLLQNRRITEVVCRRENLRYPLPPLLNERVQGAIVTSVSRRAKFILVHLNNELTWLMHLGMSGRIHGLTTPPGKHDHVLIYTDDNQCLAFNDTRRFGYMDILSTSRLTQSSHFKNLGVEPLELSLTADYAYSKFRLSRRPIKTALLDQSLIVGLGNIYVCESLWGAGIHPERSCNTLGLKDWQRLVPMIVDVLTKAIAAGGSTLRDYRNAAGESGYFQHTFAVYDCAGQPCQHPHCRGTIKRIVQAGRSTFLCESCQK